MVYGVQMSTYECMYMSIPYITEYKLSIFSGVIKRELQQINNNNH